MRLKRPVFDFDLEDAWEAVESLHRKIGPFPFYVVVCAVFATPYWLFICFPAYVYVFKFGIFCYFPIRLALWAAEKFLN